MRECATHTILVVVWVFSHQLILLKQSSTEVPTDQPDADTPSQAWVWKRSFECRRKLPAYGASGISWDLYRTGPRGRKRSHWGHGLGGDAETAISCLSLFPSCHEASSFLYQALCNESNRADWPRLKASETISQNNPSCSLSWLISGVCRGEKPGT